MFVGSKFLLDSFSYRGQRIFVIEGLWGQNRIPCNIVNVYAPSTRSGRKTLWLDLKEVINRRNGCWILGGDFNAVKCKVGRIGKYFDKGSIYDFSNFIDELELVDLQMSKRRFTRYKHDGTSMTRLDRFLFSSDMTNAIGKHVQVGLNRKISDHCHVLLKPDVRHWVPGPFTTTKREMDCVYLYHGRCLKTSY